MAVWYLGKLGVLIYLMESAGYKSYLGVIGDVHAYGDEKA